MDNVLTYMTFIPVAGAVVVLALPNNAKLIRWVSAAATVPPLLLAIWLFKNFDRAKAGFQFIEDYYWIPSFNISYTMGVDGLSISMVLLTALLSFICIFASFGIEKAVKGYFALFLLLDAGMMGVFCALDFFLFYVFWEVMLLPMYFLIGIWGGPRREYAAIKFFLYTLAGSVLMLVAVVALRIESGTFSIPDLVAMAQHGGLTGSKLPFGGVLVGLKFTTWVFWFLFVAFAIKVPVFPFHTWLPDAHVQAPTPISVILAGILLKLGGYGMLRACFPIVPDAYRQFAFVLGVLGAISIVYGSYVALGQTDFKRLIAYSSVGHMGYVLLGFACM